MIVDLADEVPPRYVSPASAVAEAELGMALIDAIGYMRSNGESGLREHCREILRTAAESTRRRIAHGNFDE